MAKSDFIVYSFNAQDQLESVMLGLQAHITDQQRGPLVKALSRLRDTVEQNSDAADHIKLALYTFPNAVCP